VIEYKPVKCQTSRWDRAPSAAEPAHGLCTLDRFREAHWKWDYEHGLSGREYSFWRALEEELRISTSRSTLKIRLTAFLQYLEAYGGQIGVIERSRKADAYGKEIGTFYNRVDVRSRVYHKKWGW
jgi:hypothetical protein